MGAEDSFLTIAAGIVIPISEIQVETSRSSGPGGQHVNKTETRVTLRLALSATSSIDAASKARVLEKLARRLTRSGEILVSCGRHREREQNLREALDRLERLLQDAWHRDPPRKKTRPSAGSKERRLAEKRHTTQRKRSRQSPPDE
ncbi:MAG: aminoacyl-tRNA hydrolase [Deltaproteobacteria bacterium]|nr:aminoacyl-tRNA hydrolase [Deltaproteobacteria bacterium]